MRTYGFEFIDQNDEFGLVFAENFNHFVELEKLIEETFGEWKGCGSYLIDGQSTDYNPTMKGKQKLLFDSSIDKKRALEIGVHAGHSLLIMLISNPTLQITAIDINSFSHTRKCIQYLNRHFNNRIIYLIGNSLNVLSMIEGKYDLFHVDGNHEIGFIRKERDECKRLTAKEATFIFDDIDTPGVKEMIYGDKSLKNIQIPASAWSNCVCDYFSAPITETLEEKLKYFSPPQNPTDLCHIMKKYGSDKGLGWHNYTTLYHHLFKDIRFNELNIFEMGLGTNDTTIPSNMGVDGKPGASLRGWREYFPNSQIYGADIDHKIIFEEERIKTYQCDQLNIESIKQMFEKIGPIEFDLILDDGLHTVLAGYTFYSEAFNHLKKGGIYIIEDLIGNYIEAFTKSLPGAKIIHLRNPSNQFDNNLAIFQK